MPESTVCGWLRDEENMDDFVDTADSTNQMKRKKARTANTFSCSSGIAANVNGKMARNTATDPV